MDLSQSKAFKYILVCIVCFVCYGNTLRNDYAYDDSVVITENQFTQKGIRGIPDIFKNNTFVGSYEGVPTVERYRPLSLATFAIEHDLFGPNPHASHFNNVLLYVLTALLLYALVLKLFGTYGDRNSLLDFPLIAVLLFVVHPTHTEIVANIKGRDEILMLAGSLSATLLVLRYLDTHKLLYLVLSFCLFSIALFSKENAITFLAIVPLTVFYYKKARWTSYLYPLLPIAVACATFLGVRGLVLGESGPLPSEDIITEPFIYASLSGRCATILYTFGMYVRLLFFPHPLTIDYYPYHIRLMSFANIAVWLSVVAYVSLAVYALWNLGKRSVISYGILFYMITFSIVSNVPFSTGTFMSERFLFAPSAGFAIAAAWLLSSRVAPLMRYRSPVVLAIVLVCSFKTCSRNDAWKDDFTLFTTDVKTSDDSIKANIAASVTLLMESHKTSDGVASATYRTDALKYSRKAVAIYEGNVDRARLKGTSYGHAVVLLGNCYGENDMLDDALQCYRKALRAGVKGDELGRMVEATIGRSSDLDFMIRSYSEFVDLLPDSFSLNYHLGYLYGKEKGDLVKAVSYLGKAVEIVPSDVDALRALSLAYKLSGSYREAAFYFERVTELTPGNVPYLNHLRELYELAGNHGKANEVRKKVEDSEKGQDK